jgi:hypothetical protein
VADVKALAAALANARALVASLELAIAEAQARGREELVTLRDGALGIPGDTLCRWASTGRLTAYTAERGRLVAWSSDIRKAIEAKPYQPPLRTVPDASDAIERELASGRLVRG